METILGLLIIIGFFRMIGALIEEIIKDIQEIKENRRRAAQEKRLKEYETK